MTWHDLHVTSSSYSWFQCTYQCFADSEHGAWVRFTTLDSTTDAFLTSLIANSLHRRPQGLSASMSNPTPKLLPPSFSFFDRMWHFFWVCYNGVTLYAPPPLLWWHHCCWLLCCESFLSSHCRVLHNLPRSLEVLSKEASRNYGLILIHSNSPGSNSPITSPCHYSEYFI